MSKRRKIYLLVFIPFLTIMVFVFFDIIQYREFIGVADAGGGCIELDAGRVGMVVEGCTIVNGACPACSTIYSPEFAMSCAGYKQVSVVGTQYGSMTFAIPNSFTNFKGGGTGIVPGDQFAYCGITKAMPIVWGAPGVGAKRIQKILDFYDYVVAGFKK